VWADDNFNGVQDAFEAGTSNVAVRLLSCAGVPAGVTLTDALGRYQFTNLVAGSYRVAFDLPTGRFFSPANLGDDARDSDADPRLGMTECVTLGATLTNATFDAGLRPRLHYVSYTQWDWGGPAAPGNAASMLLTKFYLCYNSRGTIVGTLRYLRFTTPRAIARFLPAAGRPGVLRYSRMHPHTTEAGPLAGHTLALRLNVDFSAKGLIPPGLGALKVAPGHKLSGRTVAEVLAVANAVLGEGTVALPAGCTLPELNEAVARINDNFGGGDRDRGFLLP
jgi:hypothetical protein